MVCLAIVGGEEDVSKLVAWLNRWYPLSSPSPFYVHDTVKVIVTPSLFSGYVQVKGFVLLCGGGGGGGCVPIGRMVKGTVS